MMYFSSFTILCATGVALASTAGQAHAAECSSLSHNNELDEFVGEAHPFCEMGRFKFWLDKQYQVFAYNGDVKSALLFRTLPPDDPDYKTILGHGQAIIGCVNIGKGNWVPIGPFAFDRVVHKSYKKGIRFTLRGPNIIATPCEMLLSGLNEKLKQVYLDDEHFIYVKCGENGYPIEVDYEKPRWYLDTVNGRQYLSANDMKMIRDAADKAGYLNVKDEWKQELTPGNGKRCVRAHVR